jgi:hypothetical protein
MNRMYGTPAGPSDGPGPAGQSDLYAHYSPGPPRKGRMLRWGAGVTLAGFLAGGAIALAVSGGSSPAAAVSPSTGVSASSQAEGTALNSAINTASSSTPSAASLPRVRAALTRLRALGGVDGQFTYHNKTGFHTLAFARGTIQSVNSADVVVKAADGTTWTWLIVGDTVVRQNGAKTTTKALAVGQPVFAGGPVVSGSKDARLIVIRPASAGSGSPSPSASGSSSVAGAPGTSVS